MSASTHFDLAYAIAFFEYMLDRAKGDHRYHKDRLHQTEQDIQRYEHIVESLKNDTGIHLDKNDLHVGFTAFQADMERA